MNTLTICPNMHARRPQLIQTVADAALADWKNAALHDCPHLDGTDTEPMAIYCPDRTVMCMRCVHKAVVRAIQLSAEGPPAGCSTCDNEAVIICLHTVDNGAHVTLAAVNACLQCTSHDTLFDFSNVERGMPGAGNRG